VTASTSTGRGSFAEAKGGRSWWVFAGDHLEAVAHRQPSRRVVDHPDPEVIRAGDGDVWRTDTDSSTAPRSPAPTPRPQTALIDENLALRISAPDGRTAAVVRPEVKARALSMCADAESNTTGW
jgi:hypothetical protein